MSTTQTWVSVDDVTDQFMPHLIEEVVPLEVDGAPTLLDQRAGNVTSLSTSAALTMQFFDGTVSLTDLAADLAEVFESDHQQIARDLTALTKELGRKGMIQGLSALAPGFLVEQPRVENDRAEEIEVAESPQPLFDTPDYLGVPPNG